MKKHFQFSPRLLSLASPPVLSSRDICTGCSPSTRRKQSRQCAVAGCQCRYVTLKFNDQFARRAGPRISSSVELQQDRPAFALRLNLACGERWLIMRERPAGCAARFSRCDAWRWSLMARRKSTPARTRRATSSPLLKKCAPGATGSPLCHVQGGQ